MERLSIDDIDTWFLSGKPVVRFGGKDFSQTVDEYADWLRELGQSCNLGVVVKKIVEPPAVVVQAYIPGDEPPVLQDPMLRVSKGSHPWYFCIYNKCRVRVPTPGMLCAAHES